MADINFVEEPVIFAHQFEKAWNQQEYMEVINYFAPDAILEISPPLPNGQDIYSGLEEVGGLVREMILGYHSDSTDYRTEGDDADTVSWLTTIESDLFRRIGAPTVDATVRLTVRGNRVQTYTLTLSPESVAKFRGQGATPPQED
jgi:hypothetical protein